MEKRPRLISKRRLFCLSGLWVLSVLFSSGLVGCEKKDAPIKVGFVGCLSGKLSALGTAGRNGAILSVEEANKGGGINGRPVELIIKDDRQDAQTALKVDRELIDEGVVAIIGHMISSMTMAVLPLMNKEKILLISPTTSTNRLTGIDDFFVRMLPPNKAETDHLARHAYDGMGLRRMSGTYDLSNRAYTKEFIGNFKDEFQALGGKAVLIEAFSSGKDVDFISLARSLLKPDPDGILIVAGPVDTAMICQRIRISGSKIPIVSCGWAMTSDFLRNGGAAVEGVVFSQLFDRNSRRKKYLEFRKRFRERFGADPSFAAAHGYEAGQALLRALSENPDPRKLKSTFLGLGRFEGVQGDFTIDKYGDPQRKRFLITVKDGKFRTLERAGR